jgi:hypothetical protein
MTRCVDSRSFAAAELALDGEGWHQKRMAKGKPTPDKSQISRERPLAYSRRHKDAADTPADGPKGDEAKAAEATAKPVEPDVAAANPEQAKAAEAKPGEAKPGEAKPEEAKAEAPAIEPPPPKGEPWPDATPQPMRPVEAPPRARADTVAMPAEVGIGAPPALPMVKAGDVEVPTHMPGPRDVPGGNVTDAALPPGLVPPGDSRSLRKGNEFALVYRVGNALISRFGTIGQRGQWRVVEYPTPASASNSYAKEVSRYVGDGFSDYRD